MKFSSVQRFLSFALLLIGMLLNSCARDPLSQLPVQERPEAHWVIYEGSLPCADCSEIKTRLELKIDYSDPEPPYILKQAYLGKQDEDQAFVTHGKYGTLKWEYRGNDATVYELNPGKQDEQVYFLRVHEDTLKMLNRKMKIFESEHNYFLLKMGQRE